MEAQQQNQDGSLSSAGVNESPLDSIRRNDNETLLALLLQGADVETRDKNGIRALSIAAGLGTIEIVHTLLSFNAQVYVDGENRNSPLNAAARRGHLPIVQKFKSKGLDEGDRSQALLDAIRQGHLPVVEELLVLPHDLAYEQSDRSGINFLANAADNGQLAITSFLLSKGASQLSLKRHWTSPLHLAAAKGYTDVAKELVEYGADLTALNGRGLTPLLVACFNNKSELAQFLVSKMSSDDLDIRHNDGISALLYGIRHVDARLVHRLLERGANPDFLPGDICAPLHMAINMHLLEIAEDLVDNGARTQIHDERGLTTLHLASASGLLPLMGRCLEDGLEIDDQSPEGFTPLYWASQAGQTDSVKYLLDHHADPNITTLLGLTALHEAAGSGNNRMVELLLAKGADVEASAFDDTRPLHHASSRWKADTVKLLLKHHADVLQVDGYGWTASRYGWTNAQTASILKSATASTYLLEEDLIQDLQKKTLSNMALLYELLCMDVKNPQIEHKLIVAITDMLILTRKISEAYDLYQLLIPLYSSRHQFKLHFSCIKCLSRSPFSELHRCTLCLPVSMCKACSRSYANGDGIQDCNGHEVIHLFRHGSSGLDEPAMDRQVRQWLEAQQRQPQQVEQADHKLPLRSIQNIYELQGACEKTDQLIKQYTATEDDMEILVRLTGASEKTDQLIKQYTATKDDMQILVLLTEEIKSILPLTRPGVIEYRELRYKLTLVKSWAYQKSNNGSYSVQDLDEALANTIEVLPLYGQDTQEWVQCSLALILFCRRRYDLEPETLENSNHYIAILKNFRDVATADQRLSPTYVVIHELLSDLHELEYKRHNLLDHLDAAILCKRAAVYHDIELSREDRQGFFDLGMLLESRFERTGQRCDINEAIGALRVYLELVADNNLNLAVGSNNLAHALDLRCTNSRTQSSEDLREALEMVEQALKISRENKFPESIRGLMLTNLGNIRSLRYEASGDSSELDLSIEAAKDSLLIGCMSNDLKAIRLSNLATRLKMRYERTLVFSDVQQGIEYAREGLQLSKVERHTVCLLLNCLAGLLSCQYTRKECSRADWNRLVRIRKSAVGLELSMPSRIIYMHNLSAVLTERYQTYHDEKDLVDAIEYGLRCLRNSSVSHSSRAKFLSGLGSRFKLLYDHSNMLADLDCALGLQEAAVRTDPLDETAFNNFASATMDRYFATKNKDDLRLTVDRMEARYLNPLFSNFGRVRGAAASGLFALELGDDVRASKLLRGAVSLLPQVYLPLIDRTDLQHVLGQLSGLPERIASSLLRNNDDSVVETLDLMESSRGIIASLAIHARNIDSMDEPSTNERLQQSVAISELDLNTSAYTFRQARKYMGLAENGPIVSFVVSQFKSSAILITSQNIKFIDLPNLQYRHLQEEAVTLVVGKDRITAGSQNTRFERNKHLNILLKWTWEVAVKPVLSSLDLLREAESESALPRIWWISSGLMGLLPLHAAGIHTRGSKENTMSHVISSYAPNLKVLKYSRQKSLHCTQSLNPSVMLAAMPKTEGLRELTIEPEITIIETTFPGTQVRRFPSEETVLQGLQSCNIGHFVCHGRSDPTDPSRSALLLQSGPLTVEKLSQHYFPNAHVMYLSACSTAENSITKLVDEVLHLASAFQVVGFPHVIGTLWEVDDETAANIASRFYGKIKEGGGKYLDEGIIARALHDAVKAQRDVGPGDPLAWAAHVHFGP
jgi:ankyrin repeat protein